MRKGLPSICLDGTKKPLSPMSKLCRWTHKAGRLLITKGLTLGKLGRYEEAIIAFEQVVHLDPDQFDAFYHKGIALAKLGRYEEAIDAYDEALHLDPRDRDTYEMKGEAFLALYPAIPPRKKEQRSAWFLI